MMVPTSGGAGSYHIVVKIAIVGIFISLGKSHSQGEESWDFLCADFPFDTDYCYALSLG